MGRGARGKRIVRVNGILLLPAPCSLPLFLPLYGGVRGGLQHHKCGSFAEVQSCACLVEGATLLFVENHQGVEPVQMEFAERLCSAGDDDVCFTHPEHFRPEDDGVGSGGAGCGDGADFGFRESGKVGHLAGGTAAVVFLDERQQVVLLSHLHEVALRDVHSADCRAVDDDHALAFQVELGIFQSLTDGDGSHEDGAAAAVFSVQPEHLCHFLVGEFHFSDGQLLVARIEVTHGADACLLFLEGAKNALRVITNRTNNAVTCYLDIHFYVLIKALPFGGAGRGALTSSCLPVRIGRLC